MKMPPEGEAQANNSDPNLSAPAGSSWDACSESLAVDGREAIPYEQLQESGIPRDVADRSVQQRQEHHRPDRSPRHQLHRRRRE